MKLKTLSAFLATGILSAALLAPLPAHAKKMGETPAPGAAPAAAEKETKFPFHGKLNAVDPSAKTFTLEGKTPRVFHVSDQTRIVKNGKAATLKDAMVGDEVGGYTLKTTQGVLEPISVRFGPKPGKEAVASPAAVTNSTAKPAASGSNAVSAATPAPKHKRAKKAPAPTDEKPAPDAASSTEPAANAPAAPAAH